MQIDLSKPENITDDATEIAGGFLVLGLKDANGNALPPKAFAISNLPGNRVTFTPTAENLYDVLKSVILGNRAEDDTAHTLTIQYPWQWVGDRRECFTDLSVTPSGGEASIVSVSITPSAANRLIRVRGVILVSPLSANPNNRRVAAFLKVKKGSGNYQGLAPSSPGNDTYLGHSPDQQNYQDWGNSEISFEFLFRSADTDTLKFNLFAKQWSDGTQDTTSNIHFNRAVNNTYATKGCTWLEVTENQRSDASIPIDITTITSADSA